MIIRKIEEIEINQIIVHRVHKKKGDDVCGIAECNENIFELGFDESETLKERIIKSFNKDNRFFKLEIEQFNEESFFEKAKKLKNSSKEEFIKKSKEIADLLAFSHDRKSIPSGLLILLNGFYQNKHFVLTIKAELQEAFTLRKNDTQTLIELINDLFLSPAKEFFKVGYIIESENDGLYPNSDYSVFVYDDNFSSGKRDLAEYFYNKFLGFTTHKNDKLLTKNFHTDVYAFINKNVKNFEDNKGLKQALKSLFREDTTGVLNPIEFAKKNFDEDLLKKYYTELASNYQYSFNKDLTLVDGRLKKEKIELLENIKIEGPSDSMENVEVLNGRTINFEKLQLSLEKGEIGQVVTIKTK